MIARAKCELGAVVIRLRMVEAENFATCRRIDHVWISRQHLPFGENTLIIERTGYRDSEVRGPGNRFARISEKFTKSRTGCVTESRMKGHAQQTALARSNDPTANIEKRGRKDRAVSQNANFAGLLNDEKASAAVMG